MKNKIDLVGHKFGRLVVLREGNGTICKNGRKIRTWICRCDCNKIIEVQDRYLKNGRKKSCGCLQIESRNKSKKTNKYIQYDIYYKVMIGDNNYFYIDTNDYEKVSKYYWNMNNSGYIVSAHKNKRILLHKYLFDDLENKFVIDHINGNKNDNRRCNLRIVTFQQNVFNNGLRSTNTSGVTGLSWSNQRKRWEVKICVNGETIHLGRYKSKEDAIHARKKAEEEYFGEYSYDNSMKLAKQFNIQEESINGCTV